LQHGATVPWRLIAAIGAIAIVGWIDDHRPLPALVRILVHIVAIAVWLWPLIAGAWSAPGAEVSRQIQSYEVITLLVFLCLWSVNLHNFMDGIDGLLAMQAIFVLTVLGVLCLRDPRTTHGFQVLLWAAAVLGFLPFNFPRARIFMGDAGSGTLGMLVAVAAVWQFSTLGTAASSGLLAVSAFLTDATCTLVSRLLGGRDWYHAHREHLYQWMVRAGMSHRRVVAWYAGWNVLIVLPLIVWLNQKPGETVAPAEAGAVLWLYIAAVMVWICGKRWCLHKVKGHAGHA
jgi:UDP-N-acetylmuramyl pentapeptide phosphotransferase/UDP-N-acetylglucosamine-1-phosphate transferase